MGSFRHIGFPSSLDPHVDCSAEEKRKEKHGNREEGKEGEKESIEIRRGETDMWSRGDDVAVDMGKTPSRMSFAYF